jgi:hypothetical protein
MNQNLCFNIFLFLIVLIFLKYISPKPDSVLFVLKKYLNFLIFKIKKIFNLLINNEDFKNITFKGISLFKDKVPSFISYHQNIFIQKMIEKNPSLNVKLLNHLYSFIEKLVTIDTDDYFLTVSDSEKKIFTNDESNKIKKIIFNKLNSGKFKFSNMIINEPISYYSNSSGKEVDPFLFTVNCDQNIGKLNIFLSIDIRNDVVRNSSYIVIKKIRINVNDNINNKLINYDISDDITNKVIFQTIRNSQEQPNFDDHNLPSDFDNPVNLNMKFNDIDYNINTNYNINLNDLVIPNYDDILNDIDNDYSITTPQNKVNISVPILDLSTYFKSNNSNEVSPSNIEDTSYNMLDNISEFRIPEESNKSTSEITLNNKSLSMPSPNNLL